MKNFSIGKDINALLTQANIAGIGSKVFPLIATPKTTFPFVVYRRNNYRPASNKDIDDEIATLEIIVASMKYEESVVLADAVAEALEHKETQNIQDIQILNSFEDFYEDTFLQHITIDIYIKN